MAVSGFEQKTHSSLDIRTGQLSDQNLDLGLGSQTVMAPFVVMNWFREHGIPVTPALEEIVYERDILTIYSGGEPLGRFDHGWQDDFTAGFTPPRASALKRKPWTFTYFGKTSRRGFPAAPLLTDSFYTQSESPIDTFINELCPDTLYVSGDTRLDPIAPDKLPRKVYIASPKVPKELFSNPKYFIQSGGSSIFHLLRTVGSFRNEVPNESEMESIYNLVLDRWVHFCSFSPNRLPPRFECLNDTSKFNEQVKLLIEADPDQEEITASWFLHLVQNLHDRVLFDWSVNRVEVISKLKSSGLLKFLFFITASFSAYMERCEQNCEESYFDGSWEKARKTFPLLVNLICNDKDIIEGVLSTLPQNERKQFESLVTDFISSSNAIDDKISLLSKIVPHIAKYFTIRNRSSDQDYVDRFLVDSGPDSMALQYKGLFEGYGFQSNYKPFDYRLFLLDNGYSQLIQNHPNLLNSLNRKSKDLLEDGKPIFYIDNLLPYEQNWAARVGLDLCYHACKTSFVARTERFSLAGVLFTYATKFSKAMVKSALGNSEPLVTEEYTKFTDRRYADGRSFAVLYNQGIDSAELMYQQLCTNISWCKIDRSSTFYKRYLNMREDCEDQFTRYFAGDIRDLYIFTFNYNPGKDGGHFQCIITDQVDCFEKFPQMSPDVLSTIINNPDLYPNYKLFRLDLSDLTYPLIKVIKIDANRWF